jgi:cbb3-type cytochrome oxidase maturation protein
MHSGCIDNAMESLYLLIPIALLFCVIAIKLLLWAISSGQYDDLDKEAWRILADDETAAPSSIQDEESPETASEKP